MSWRVFGINSFKNWLMLKGLFRVVRVIDCTFTGFLPGMQFSDLPWGLLCLSKGFPPSDIGFRALVAAEILLLCDCETCSLTDSWIMPNGWWHKTCCTSWGWFMNKCRNWVGNFHSLDVLCVSIPSFKLRIRSMYMYIAFGNLSWLGGAFRDSMNRALSGCSVG